MKNNIFITLLLLVITLGTIKANEGYDTIKNDKEYFSSFKKNEEPSNIKFNVLFEKGENFANSFYVIYKKNLKGEEFYFKIVLDKNEIPIATYYATDENSEISNETINNLKNLFSVNKLAPEIPPVSTTQCVTNCHRARGCYDKPTGTGVLLCSAECGIECA